MGSETTIGNISFTGTTSADYLQGIDSLYQPVLSVIVVSISALASILNIIHIVLLRCLPKIKELENFRTYVCLLATTDVLLSFHRAVLSNRFTQQYMLSPGGRWLCVSSGMYSHGLTLNIAQILLLISIDRLLAFKRIRDYQSVFFIVHFRAIILISSMITITIVIAASGLLSRGFEVKGTAGCKSTLIGSFAGLIALLEVICVLVIYVTIIKYSRQRIESQQLTANKYNYYNVLLVVGLIIASMIIFWLPLIVTLILRAHEIECLVCEWLSSICTALNSIINPLLYGLANKDYRHHVKKILCAWDFS